MVQAALQAVPGASRYYHGGTNIYGTMGHKLYPAELRAELERGGNGRGTADKGANYATRANYHRSKLVHTTAIAHQMRAFLGATWALAESGAAGPTFAPPDMACSFACVTVVGPHGLEESALYETDHADRERSMWQFTVAVPPAPRPPLARASPRSFPPRRPPSPTYRSRRRRWTSWSAAWPRRTRRTGPPSCET
jgi:hypothetical protein